MNRSIWNRPGIPENSIQMASALSLFAAVIWIVRQMFLVSVCMWIGPLLSVRLQEVFVWGLDLAPHCFTIARQSRSQSPRAFWSAPRHGALE